MTACAGDYRSGASRRVAGSGGYSTTRRTWRSNMSEQHWIGFDVEAFLVENYEAVGAGVRLPVSSEEADAPRRRADA